MTVLEFRGSAHFRTRIICSLLSSRKIRIYDIRAQQEDLGLKDYEISFLRLVDKLTNGSTVVINETGTELNFRPGVLVGGRLSHACPNSRCISYFLEAVMCIAPFMKTILQLTLTGVTNTLDDPAVDVLRNVHLAILKKFGIPDETLEIKVQKRGAPPLGGGQVYFSCPFIRELVPIKLLEEGLIQRVRGIAYATRVSPDHANRMVESSKKALKPFITNVFITTDVYKGAEAGLSPGYGIILVAESTTGAQISVDTIASPGELPEDVAQRASKLLIEEIFKGGYVDSSSQFLPLLLMSICPEDVSKIRIGALAPHTVGLLRHLKDFFGTKCKIVEDRETNTLVLSCLGSGYKNFNRKVW